MTDSIVSQCSQLLFYTLDGAVHCRLELNPYVFLLWLIFPKLCPFWRVSGSRASTWASTSAMRNDLKLNTRYMSKCCSSSHWGRSWVSKRVTKEREREGEGFCYWIEVILFLIGLIQYRLSTTLISVILLTTRMLHTKYPAK